ncbi:MAG: tetratricopeptide repeat protein, partial [Burkholderiales bacterium]
MANRHTGNRDRALALMEQRGIRNPAIADPLVGSVDALSQSAQYYLQRGYASLGENRAVEAIDAFQQAVDVAPNDVSARVSLAQALGAAGRTQEAMLHVNAALELDADYAPAHYRKGALLDITGDADAAVAQYRTAVELDPGYTNARLMLGYALMRRHDFSAAAEQFAELSERQPGGVIVRYRLGLARLGAGDCEQAQPPLEEARQLDPRAGEILEALARAYATCASAGERKRRAALDAARLLYDARPQPEQAATLAMALAANDRFDEAAKLQSQVIDAERAGADADLLSALEE